MVAGLGYLLPTLCIIKSQLLELLDRPAPLSLTICQSLVRALLDGINSRFSTVLDDTKVQLASAVHPKFKLDWVEVQKSLVVERLKRAVEIEHRSEETQQDCPTAFAHESHQDQPHVTAATPPAKDFFARITSKRNDTVARPDADAEVESYLSDPSTELSSLKAYPNIQATSQCRCKTSVLPQWTSLLSSSLPFVQ